MMMVMWVLLPVAGWAVFGYGLARLRGGHDDALVWSTLSSILFFVAVIFTLINIIGG